MRKLLAAALAKHIGKELTVEVARDIVRLACDELDRSIDPQQFGQGVCGSLLIQAERFRDIWQELEPLHAAHYAETEKHRQGLALDPDIPAAIADERNGALVQFTVRHDGKLVGNLRVYLRMSRHTGTRYMVEDTLYLLPEYRRGRVAVRLLEFMEDGMRTLWVCEMRSTTKNVNSAGRLLEHLQWQPVETGWVKMINKGVSDVL
jgi:GNAT superfamily N-acetyltransferase